MNDGIQETQPVAKQVRLSSANTPMGRFRQQPSAVIASAILAFMVLAAIGAPLISPHDPLATSADSLAGPSLEYLFGTDELGRDILSRLIYGARASFVVVFGAPLVAFAIGVPLGLLGGYFGGFLDSIIMRVVDLLLAVPGILLALLIVTLLGPSWINLILAIGIGSVPEFARLARAATLELRKLDFVAAAQSMGASSFDILLRTILPNALGVLLVQVVITASTAVLLEAGLSFLGLGTQPPTPSWGGMLQTARSYLYFSTWYSIMPGLALVTTVLCLDRIGRGLQVAFSSSQLEYKKVIS